MATEERLRGINLAITGNICYVLDAIVIYLGAKYDEGELLDKDDEITFNNPDSQTNETMLAYDLKTLLCQVREIIQPDGFTPLKSCKVEYTNYVLHEHPLSGFLLAFKDEQLATSIIRAHKSTIRSGFLNFFWKELNAQIMNDPKLFMVFIFGPVLNSELKNDKRKLVQFEGVLKQLNSHKYNDLRYLTDEDFSIDAPPGLSISFYRAKVTLKANQDSKMGRMATTSIFKIDPAVKVEDLTPIDLKAFQDKLKLYKLYEIKDPDTFFKEPSWIRIGLDIVHLWLKYQILAPGFFPVDKAIYDFILDNWLGLLTVYACLECANMGVAGVGNPIEYYLEKFYLKAKAEESFPVISTQDYDLISKFHSKVNFVKLKFLQGNPNVDFSSGQPLNIQWSVLPRSTLLWMAGDVESFYSTLQTSFSEIEKQKTELKQETTVLKKKQEDYQTYMKEILGAIQQPETKKLIQGTVDADKSINNALKEIKTTVDKVQRTVGEGSQIKDQQEVQQREVAEVLETLNAINTELSTFEVK